MKNQKDFTFILQLLSKKQKAPFFDGGCGEAELPLPLEGVGGRLLRLLRLRIRQVSDVDELRLLDELRRCKALVLLLLGEEADVDTADVLLWRELLVGLRTAAGVGQRGVEGAETVDIDLLRLQEHLDDARAVLLQHAVDNVGRIYRAVLSNVLRHLAVVHSFNTL